MKQVKLYKYLVLKHPFTDPASLILWGSVKHFSSLLSFYSPPHFLWGKNDATVKKN